MTSCALTLPGARIHCTQDGGASWNRTFWAPATSSTGYSLMEIQYATDNDVWAVGGEMGSFSASTLSESLLSVGRSSCSAGQSLCSGITIDS